jgi:hypothetical protein
MEKWSDDKSLIGTSAEVTKPPAARLFERTKKRLLGDEEGVVKAITHLPPEAGTMGGDPASNL